MSSSSAIDSVYDVAVQTMLLNVLNNLPRLHLSSSQFKVILWLLKQCGVKDIPSFGAFWKLQNKLRASGGTWPTVHTSSVGNIFYTNDVRDSVARVCNFIPLYSHVIMHIWCLIRFCKPRSCQTSEVLPWGNRRAHLRGLAGYTLEGIQAIGAHPYVCTWLETLLHPRSLQT